jgi:hypothetical protein
MRTFICQFVMLSVLFMSAEGAMDVATDGLPHSDDLMQQIDAAQSSSNDTSSDSNLEGVQCLHYYHGHVVGIAPNFHAPTTHIGATERQHGEIPSGLNYAQAPPTPPPNA